MRKINFEYIDNGNDVAYVFLHGWGLSGNSFDKIISLMGDVSFLKIDLPGFGKSNIPKDYFDTYEYSYQIFLLLKRLNLRKIILVGHSFGGRLSILLSSVFCLSVEFCVLTSSAGLNRFSLIKWFKIKKYKLIKWLVEKRIFKAGILSKYGSKDYQSARPSMKRILMRVVNQDLKIFLARIDALVFLVWDKKDKDTRYWICKKIFRRVKQSEIINLINGGHFCAFYNKNKFAKILLNLTQIV